jgi:hypothetical protein
VKYIVPVAFAYRGLVAFVDYGRIHVGLEVIYFGREWVMLIRHAFVRDAPRIQLVVFSYVDYHSRGVYTVVDSPTHQLILFDMKVDLQVAWS